MTRALVAAIFFVLALVAPTPARAGQSEPKRPVDRVTWLELGGGVATIFGPDIGWTAARVGARANVTRKAAVDMIVDFDPSDRGFSGIYELQVRQTFRASNRPVAPFLSAGLIGEFEFRHVRESRFTLPTTGETIVYPEHRIARFSTPFAAVAGGGIRVPLAAHLALETGAQIWIAGGFALAWYAGVTVPIGPER
jgi:hypothetical protein